MGHKKRSWRWNVLLIYPEYPDMWYENAVTRVGKGEKARYTRDHDDHDRLI